jgi:DNA-binding response OmpR family regulator
MQQTQGSQKVVVVDDSPVLLEATCSILEEAGYRVFPVDNPLMLPSLVRRESPDLIILDLNMPTIRGDDAATIIHRLGVDVAKRVVLYSDDRNLPAIAKKAGVAGSISKAVSEEELVSRVAAMLKSAA